jgi:hypothetical protein
MAAQEALRAFAHRLGLRVSSCDIIDANVGEKLSLQATVWRRDRRVAILGADTLLELSIRIPDQKLVFAINAPDRILVLRHQVTTIGAIPVYGRRATSAILLEWLRDHAASIESLRLSPRESLHFAQNEVAAVLEPNRDIDSVLTALLDIVDLLPVMPPQPSKVDTEELPPALRPLVRYFSRLAVDDDDLRTQRLASLNSRQVISLLNDVSPLLAEIDSYLNSFRDRPLTETAILMGRLAEAVAELRAREA